MRRLLSSCSKRADLARDLPHGAGVLSCFSHWTASRDRRTFTGFVVSERVDAVLIREATGVERMLKRADLDWRLQVQLPERLVANLTAEQLSDLAASLQSLK